MRVTSLQKIYYLSGTETFPFKSIISHDYQCQVLIEVALVSVVREVRIVYVYKYENKIPVPD